MLALLNYVPLLQVFATCFPLQIFRIRHACWSNISNLYYPLENVYIAMDYGKSPCLIGQYRFTRGFVRISVRFETVASESAFMFLQHVQFLSLKLSLLLLQHPLQHPLLILYINFFCCRMLHSHHLADFGGSSSAFSNKSLFFHTSITYIVLYLITIVFRPFPPFVLGQCSKLGFTSLASIRGTSETSIHGQSRLYCGWTIDNCNKNKLQLPLEL